jgi:hypothetical protein
VLGEDGALLRELTLDPAGITSAQPHLHWSGIRRNSGPLLPET